MERAQTDMTRLAKTRLRLSVDSSLYTRLERMARKHRRTKRSLLEQALRFYFQMAVSSQRGVRPEVLAHYRKSAARNKRLLRLPAR